MSITGSNFIGYKLSAAGNKTFKAFSPGNNEFLSTEFFIATDDEFQSAINLADAAFHTYSDLTSTTRALFLQAISEEILALGNELIERCTAESGLPEARILGERGRTCGQLKMFAELLREGWWMDARIDTAQPDRNPLPKPDIRRVLIPIGPVAVYGVSNFPLAFSTAGGDTVSALASGCPVVFKAHPSHPGTNSLISTAIIKAAKKTNMPEGVFSSLYLDDEYSIKLVQHPAIKAAGFTGSRSVGMKLFDASVRRPEPIPVYAEMSSINPFIILEGAIKSNGLAIAKGLANSVTLGSGQFCTNPGLILTVDNDVTGSFIEEFAKQLTLMLPSTMLNKNICNTYSKGVTKLKGLSAVKVLAQSSKLPEENSNESQPIAFAISGDDFLSNILFKEEIFGPATLLVFSKDVSQLYQILESLEGQLTTTIHSNVSDEGYLHQIIQIITRKAGRIIYGGYPTGVEVCHAMQHGGPFPSTTDSRSTSVGSAAILRFLRPIAYQDFPDHLLPAPLKNSNPLNISRLIDGVWTKNSIH